MTWLRNPASPGAQSTLGPNGPEQAVHKWAAGSGILAQALRTAQNGLASRTEPSGGSSFWSRLVQFGPRARKPVKKGMRVVSGRFLHATLMTPQTGPRPIFFTYIFYKNSGGPPWVFMGRIKTRGVVQIRNAQKPTHSRSRPSPGATMFSVSGRRLISWPFVLYGNLSTNSLPGDPITNKNPPMIPAGFDFRASPEDRMAPTSASPRGRLGGFLSAP